MQQSRRVVVNGHLNRPGQRQRRAWFSSGGSWSKNIRYVLVGILALLVVTNHPANAPLTLQHVYKVLQANKMVNSSISTSGMTNFGIASTQLSRLTGKVRILIMGQTVYTCPATVYASPAGGFGNHKNNHNNNKQDSTIEAVLCGVVRDYGCHQRPLLWDTETVDWAFTTHRLLVASYILSFIWTNLLGFQLPKSLSQNHPIACLLRFPNVYTLLQAIFGACYLVQPTWVRLEELVSTQGPQSLLRPTDNDGMNYIFALIMFLALVLLCIQGTLHISTKNPQVRNTYLYDDDHFRNRHDILSAVALGFYRGSMGKTVYFFLPDHLALSRTVVFYVLADYVYNGEAVFINCMAWILSNVAGAVLGEYLVENQSLVLSFWNALLRP